MRPGVSRLLKLCVLGELYARFSQDAQVNETLQTQNKLNEIKPNFNSKCTFSNYSRKEQTKITRCRIGHTRITHSYILKNEQAPFCIPCNEPFTVKHFLITCLHHWGVQLILAYSWARPAILVVGKGRGGMFLFLLFLHFHSCSSFFPVPLFHLYSLSYISFLPFSGRRHKMTLKG